MLSLANDLEAAAIAMATVLQFVYSSDWEVVPIHCTD
jgi:hypothetical protein